MSDCTQFDALIARAGKLSTEEAALLDAHLATCVGCRDLARLMRPVDVDFQFTVGDTQIDGASPRERTSTGDNHRYRITGEVGRGGIGRVMEALDQVLDRPVALKELFAGNADLRRRFVREALITARLQHPSIVPIYDAGHLGDRSPFYAMKLVAGQPLHNAIEQASTLSDRLALLPRVLAVAEAMAYAHSKRIIHRDLKPANILVGAFGETIVIDWGLAKDLADTDDAAPDAGPYRAADQTVAGMVMGTPAFMAPEQAARESVDERADVYALGAILYQLISGVAPHEGNTLDEVLRQVISGDIRPVAEREPTVPRDLAAIVTKAMALAPADRYANATGLAEDLSRFLTGKLVGSHTYGTRELLRRWVKRHRAAVTVAFAAFLAIAFVGVVSVRRVVQARELAEEQSATATRSLANLLEEQGRQELLAGRPKRALAYLSEAYVNDSSVALRTLLAEAMRSVEPADATVIWALGGQPVALSADGTRALTHDAKLWDRGKLVASLEGEITAASFHGEHVVTASGTSAKVWNAKTGSLLATLAHPETIQTVAFSADGARVVTSNGQRLWIWNATGTLIAELAPGPSEYPIRVSKDGTRILMAGGLKTAHINSVDDGKRLVELATDVPINAAVFSPNGERVVTASIDQAAKVWNARTGALIATLEGTTRFIFGGWFNPDGTRVITTSDNNSAKLWDASTGKLLASYDGHAADIQNVSFSPDGRVLTTSADGIAKLWDERTGKLLASFNADALFATIDDTHVTIASRDGALSIRDIHPETRSPEEIRRIVGERNSWKLSNGVLLPDDR